MPCVVALDTNGFLKIYPNMTREQAYRLSQLSKTEKEQVFDFMQDSLATFQSVSARGLDNLLYFFE